MVGEGGLIVIVPVRTSISIAHAIIPFILFMAMGGGCSSSDEAPFDPWLFLDGDLSSLPRFTDSRLLSFSSYDRWGRNDDGFSGLTSAIRIDENGEHVLAEAKGPGSVRRIWMTWPGLDTELRIYIDGKTPPAIAYPLDEFFSGLRMPFLPPWVGSAAHYGGVFFSQVPILFTESVKITSVDRLRFYQIEVEQLPAGTKVKSFTAEVDQLDVDRITAAQDLLGRLPERASFEIPWSVPPSEDDREYDLEVKIPPGPGTDETIFESNSKGEVREIRIQIEGGGDALRETHLIAWWDGRKEPAIHVPLADLFGSAHGEVHMKSAGIISSENIGIVRLPMPYKRAKIVLRNTGPEVVHARARILVGQVTDLKNKGRLHATWSQSLSVMGESIHVLHIRGRGHLVGTILSATAARTERFLEGDETIRVDSDTAVTIHGTGTEDQFNSGWYFAPSSVELPFHGVPFRARGDAPRISAYRFRFVDRIPFTHSLSYEQEHGDSNDEPGTEYSIITLWYGEPGATWGSPPPPVGGTPFLNRRVVYPASTIIPDSIVSLRGSGIPDERKIIWPDLVEGWDSPAGAHGQRSVIPFLRRLKRPSAWYESTVPVVARGRYRISLVHARSPGFGLLDADLGGERLFQSLDLHGDSLLPVVVSQAKGVWTLPEGDLPIRILVREGTSGIPPPAVPIGSPLEKWDRPVLAIVGGLLLDPIGSPVLPWSVVGPFPNYADRGFDTVYPPEQEHLAGGIRDRAGSYDGGNGDRVSWREVRADPAGFLDLRKSITPISHQVAYGLTWCYAAEDRRVLFSMGGDDGLAVWVNGRPVWKNHIHRAFKADEDRFPVDLHRGWNEILVKVDQFIAGWGFSLRVNDPDGALTFSTTKD